MCSLQAPGHLGQKLHVFSRELDEPDEVHRQRLNQETPVTNDGVRRISEDGDKIEAMFDLQQVRRINRDSSSAASDGAASDIIAAVVRVFVVSVVFVGGFFLLQQDAAILLRGLQDIIIVSKGLTARGSCWKAIDAFEVFGRALCPLHIVAHKVSNPHKLPAARAMLARVTGFVAGVDICDSLEEAATNAIGEINPLRIVSDRRPVCNEIAGLLLRDAEMQVLAIQLCSWQTTELAISQEGFAKDGWNNEGRAFLL